MRGEKLKAVELFIKHDKRPFIGTRSMGFGTENVSIPPFANDIIFFTIRHHFETIK